MRKLILSMQVSLDGYVDGKNGDMSWMKPDQDESWDDLFTMLNNVDLFLLGRGMWAEYRDHWKKVLTQRDSSPANEVKYADLAEKTKHIVFSKSVKDAGWHNSIINSGDAVKEVRKIKEQSGGDIQIIGGADFAATMLDSGLVDICRLLVNPAFAGGGKSYLHQIKKAQQLELIASRQLNNQIMVLDYKLLNDGNGNDATPSIKKKR